MPLTLDRPPVIVRQSRLKLALRVVLFAGLTVVLAAGAFISGFLKNEIWAWLGVSFLVPIALGSAVAALASAWSFASPATLTLEESGLVYRAYWYARHYRWSDIAEFYLLAPSNFLRSPACALTNAVNGRRHASFGRAWTMSAEDILELLNAAKAKWGEAPSSGLPQQQGED